VFSDGSRHARKERLNPNSTHISLHMFAEYIAAALERAKYEIIEDPEPYYASVPGLQGVWATGKTFEECRRELISTIEGWIVLGLRMGHPIPSIDGHAIGDLGFNGPFTGTDHEYWSILT
jgi:predicted RNase H-like HicB family nuclease